MATRNSAKHVPPSGSSLLSVDMGLSVIPYQIRPLNIPDLNQRFRRLHMRAPLRSLIAPMPIEFPPPLEINARSLRNRQINLPSSNEVEQQQFRRQSLLSSPSLVAEEQDWSLSINNLHHRRLQRSRSNSK